MKVINLIFDLFKPDRIRKSKKPSQYNLASELFEMQKQIIIWGSDSVFERWTSFRRETEKRASEDNSSVDSLAPVLHAIGGLILSIRKDIGYSGTNISELDFATLILRVDDAENQKLLEELRKLQ